MRKVLTHTTAFIFTLGYLLIPSLGSAQKITFSKHIAPIIQKNCTPCHHEGTAAPFSLLTYQDVVEHGKTIKLVTGQRYMPPWKADASYSSFENEKVLTQSEINMIKDWVDQGMPKGGNVKIDNAKNSHPSSFSRNPDAVLSVQKQYQLKGDGTENFILFVIPFEFDEEKNIESIEYTSTFQKAIHHANFGIYEVDESIDISGDTAALNANNMMRFSERYAALTKKLIYYNGWVPGSSPITFPKNIGFKMPKRGVVILTNHYSPLSYDVKELSSIKLFFTSHEIKRTIGTFNIGSGGVGEVKPRLILWPNEINSFKIQIEIVEPMSLIYVWPHMHLLGKTFKSYYVVGQDTIPLVRINKWDFNWQEAYKFKKLVKLPKGAILTVEGSYDNTASNPNNPYSPPQIIFSDGFMGTKNEMLSLIFVYLHYQDGDENIVLSPGH